MAAKMPVDFEEKVKQAPSADGKGYPYQISAKDLMKDFNFLLKRVLPDALKGAMLYYDGINWTTFYATPDANGGLSVLVNNGDKPSYIDPPSSTGTFVLGVVDGEMQWLSTEECA